jgi:hypothetical protein
MTAATLTTGILTEIAGQPVPQLARQFGTPVYVYDAATICRRIADLAAFDVVRYAQKACSNLAILDLVRHSPEGREGSRRCAGRATKFSRFARAQNEICFRFAQPRHRTGVSSGM